MGIDDTDIDDTEADTLKQVKYLLILALLCAALLAGCGSNGGEAAPENAVRIYCLDKNRKCLAWEYYEPKRTDYYERTYELLDKLRSEPEDGDYKALLQSDIVIRDFSFGEDGQLIIDFGAGYQSMDTITELLCRAGIVKTMCQLDNVEFVEFYVEGQPLMHGETAVGQMTSEDFIDNTGGSVQFTQSVSLTVYFADNTGEALEETVLVVETSGTSTLAEMALQQLIEGPPEQSEGLLFVLPEDTGLNKVTVWDGVAYVDFNAAFLNPVEGVSDAAVVYSVVNTLCEISNITKVQITVDGVQAKNRGSVDISGLLVRNTELIKGESVQ